MYQRRSCYINLVYISSFSYITYSIFSKKNLTRQGYTLIDYTKLLLICLLWDFECVHEQLTFFTFFDCLSKNDQGRAYSLWLWRLSKHLQEYETSNRTKFWGLLNPEIISNREKNLGWHLIRVTVPFIIVRKISILNLAINKASLALLANLGMALYPGDINGVYLTT